jgi:hypothetical protein
MTRHNFIHMDKDLNEDLDELAMSCSAAVLGCGFEHRPGARAKTGGETPSQPAGVDACAT